ncbi:MAG: PKD domain-containing protein [Planctomycetota bacterium]
MFRWKTCMPDCPRRKGQSIVEYALILGLLCLAAVLAIGTASRSMEKPALRLAADLGAPASGESPGDVPDDGAGEPVLAAEATSGSDLRPASTSGADGRPDSLPARARTVLYRVREDPGPAQREALQRVLRKLQMREERPLLNGRVRMAKAGAADAPGVEGISRALRATGAVEFAEPDYLIAPVALPDDPSYDSQWHHETIESARAWDYCTGDASIIVAVCDTGVQADHPDLSANMASEGYNAVDGSSDTSPVMNHGTQVAGCVGAVGNNTTGVSGVNWTVSIMPIRVTNRSDGYAYYSDMARGIQWAADHGARVANLSYLAAGSYTIDSAAHYLRDKGGLLFVAAGNNGADQTGTWPDFTSFVAVGATTSSDTRASFSNYGEFIDLVAPGSSIRTTTTGGSYATVSGTSFSSPIAAGVAALAWSADPAQSPAQLEELLFSTCVDLGDAGEDNVYGHGRVDSGAALAKLGGEAPNQPPTASVTATPTSGTAPMEVSFDGSGSADNDGSIASYAWDFGDGSTATGATVVHTYSDAGSYSATLTVTDDDGATDSASVTVTVDAPNAAPTASASAMPTSGTVPLEVSFDGSGSTDSDGSIASYTWDFGDGDTASGATVTHTYSDAGSYAATLTVTDDDGATDSASVTVTVDAPNAAPTASASAMPTSGTVPLEVSFDGSGSTDSDGSIASYTWDFGDGDTASGATVTHTYSDAGSYTATLTVTDDGGATDSASVTVTVDAPNAAPTASASAMPTSGTVPLEVSFDGSGSTDSDGSIASYTWDFGDGDTASGATVTHTYSDAGSYTATLTVTDDDGATDSASVTVTVEAANEPPAASASATPTSGTVPLAVYFDGSASVDADGSVVDYRWDFGNGATAEACTLSYTYEAAGSYQAVLTVTDDDGATDSAAVTITVESANEAPVASASATPTSGTAPLEVNFDGSASSDGDGTITQYTWDFADGSTGSGATVSHIYSEAGTYDATLTVVDNYGTSASDTVTVTVETPNSPPTASVSATPTSGFVPLEVSFDGSGSTDSDGNIASYTWEFGDGHSGTGAVVSHAYDEAGTYTATLTVSDDDGATDTAAATIEVEEPNAPPVASITANPTSGTAPLEVAFDGSASSDSDGSIASYQWDLGDGTTADTVSPQHTYEAAGTYQVTLTVTDDDGATESDSATITVEDAANRVIYVAFIELSIMQDHGGDRVVGAVSVTDADGQAVEGATVSTEWSGILSGSDSVSTSAGGVANVISKKTRDGGTVQLTVTGVSASGCEYDPEQNVETSETIELIAEKPPGQGDKK